MPAGTNMEPDARSGRFEVVGVGSSAGGLSPLLEVLGSLPEDFPAAVLVVQHLSPHRASLIPELFRGHLQMPMEQAREGDQVRPGRIYIAPPDGHLLVESGVLHISKRAPVRFSRPSIDVTFESLAAAYGPRCIVVVLSGALRDGSQGLAHVKQAGGVTLVQDPEEAEFRSMPDAAVATGCVDHVLQLHDIGPTLVRLCQGADA